MNIAISQGGVVVKWLVLFLAVVAAGMMLSVATSSASDPGQCSVSIQTEPNPEGLACTPWVRHCGSDGYWYRCEPCGSQWCDIFKGVRCK